MTNVISALALATGLTVVLLTVTNAKVIPPYLKRSTQSFAVIDVQIGDLNRQAERVAGAEGAAGVEKL
jgi:hypothetical protein